MLALGNCTFLQAVSCRGSTGDRGRFVTRVTSGFTGFGSPDVLLPCQVIPIDVLVLELALAVSTPDTFPRSFSLRALGAILFLFRPTRNFVRLPQLLEFIIKACKELSKILQGPCLLDETLEVFSKLSNVLEVLVRDLLGRLHLQGRRREHIENVEILNVREPLNTRKVQVFFVRGRKIQELSEALLTSKHIVDFHSDRLAFARLAPLVGSFEILDRLVWVASVKVLDLIQLLVELLKLITRGNRLELLLARAVRIFVDLE